MSKLIYLALGGALGTVLRYSISVWFGASGSTEFPVATFIANMVGCLAIGIVMGLFIDLELTHPLRLFFVIGLLGGFTTFSAFAFEGYSLIQANQIKTAAIYILSSNLLGVLLVVVGYQLIKLFQ